MGRRRQAERVLDVLAETIDSPTTELVHDDAFELTVSVVLSAQCTDDRVNQVTPALFDAFPDIGSMARVEPEDVLPYIRSVTFPNNKARHLVGLARRVQDAYGGAIPRTIPELETLPGVGRKSARVVASVVYDTAALPVDTHVFRVSHRLGLVLPDARTPDAVESQLTRVIPKSRWSDAHHLLILHGRYTCRARGPACGTCPVEPLCPFRRAVLALPAPVNGLDPRRGAYWCGTRRHYFETPVLTQDRQGVEQYACPRCGSMNVFASRTGSTLRRVRDLRANDGRRRTRTT